MSKKEKSIEDRVLALEQKTSGLPGKVETARATISEVKKVLALLDEKHARKELGLVQERLAHLSRRIRVEILKAEVLSEVTRIFPGMWPQLVAALDKDYEWWEEGIDFTIKQWRERVKDLRA